MVPPEQKQLELSFLNQQPHIRVYRRYYIIFPFPSPYSHTNTATDALRTGFSSVLQKFPYLAGTMTISPTHPNQLQILYSSAIDG
jgi:hypothetical protein